MEPSRNLVPEIPAKLDELASILENSKPDGWVIASGAGVEAIQYSFSEVLETFVSGGQGKIREIRSLLQDTRVCLSAPSVPIIAVMGLLNAGKSSLVSTFLSDEGRRRVLVGSSNTQGTHRFVLWMPSSFRRDATVWSYVETRLQALFGCVPEQLSEDPLVAAQQYNDTRTRQVGMSLAESDGDRASGSSNEVQAAISIPLIAFDEQLDRYGIALMDCPDVQTGFLGHRGLEEFGDKVVDRAERVALHRVEVLARVSPICSAFMVVLPANAMHDQKVTELMHLLRNRMPHTPQFIAVNRVPRRYTTEEIRSELDKLYGLESLHRLYMAYSFEGPNQRERLPKPPDHWSIPTQNALPLFFRIDQVPVPQPPHAMKELRWMLDLGRELDPKGLLSDAIRSHTSRLQTEMITALQTIRKKTIEVNRSRENMLQSLVRACVHYSLEPGSSGRVRLQASKQIVEQISQSLERTAPWWARPGRWTTRMTEYGKSQVGQLSQWIKVPAWLSERTEGLVQFIQRRWNSGDSAKIVTADALLDAIAREDIHGDWHLDDDSSLHQESRDRIRQAVQHGIDRFMQESRVELDLQQLDEITKAMWAQMPWSKRLMAGLAPAAVLFAPLLAVMLIPLDFGGTSVLVFASLKELLGAGVAGIGMAMLSPDRIPKIAESEAAWKQLGDLVAVLCDSLGLDRPNLKEPIEVNLGAESRAIYVSAVPTNMNPERSFAATDRPVPHRMICNDSGIERIEQLLLSLSQ